MTAFFTLAVLLIFPLLYFSFVNALPFACILNFVTVLCFLGIHAVARELEEPFKNVPNGNYWIPVNGLPPFYTIPVLHDMRSPTQKNSLL